MTLEMVWTQVLMHSYPSRTCARSPPSSRAGPPRWLSSARPWVCPGNHESAGKRRSASTGKGNAWLRAALSQAAWAASRTKGSYYRALYHRHKALGPRREVPRRGEPRHVVTRLRQDRLSRQARDARHALQELDSRGERAGHGLDPGVQLADPLRQMVNGFQLLPKQEPVMAPHQAGNHFRELLALAAERPPGQSGQDLRILLPFDHGLREEGPSGQGGP